MKYPLILFIAFVSLTNNIVAQGEGTIQISKAEAEQETKNLDNIKVKGIKFGISLGYNYAFSSLYDARISPVDTTLDLQSVLPYSFLLSTTLSFPITIGPLRGSYYRKIDHTGKPTGEVYFVPYGLAVVATVNLVTFNSSLGGAGLFNQKLDGGLGIGYTFGENVQAALTFEMISFRQPRDFLIDSEGKTVKVNGVNLASIPIDDNDYYTDRYLPSLSFKVVYIIN